MDIEEAMTQWHNYGYITLECGCNVEPDGKCPCGNVSPLLEAGLI